MENTFWEDDLPDMEGSDSRLSNSIFEDSNLFPGLFSDMEGFGDGFSIDETAWDIDMFPSFSDESKGSKSVHIDEQHIAYVNPQDMQLQYTTPPLPDVDTSKIPIVIKQESVSKEKCEPRTHLSAQSTSAFQLRTQPFAKILVRNVEVNMSMEDYRINATQICKAVGLNKQERRFLFNRMDHDVGHRHEAWLSFKQGVCLSYTLGLFDELKSLFSASTLPLPSEEESFAPKAFEIRTLQWENQTIIFIPSTKEISGTQLLHATTAGIQRARYYLAKGITKRILYAMGSYRAFLTIDVATKWCKYHGVSDQAIGAIIERMDDTPVDDHPRYFAFEILGMKQNNVPNQSANKVPQPRRSPARKKKEGSSRRFVQTGMRLRSAARKGRSQT